MSTIRPSGFPGWASGSAATNIAQPTAQQLAQGWSTNQAPPSSYDNWFKSLVYGWLKFHDPGDGLWRENLIVKGFNLGGPTTMNPIPNYAALSIISSASAGGPLTQNLFPTGSSGPYQGRSIWVTPDGFSGHSQYLASTEAIAGGLYPSGRHWVDFEWDIAVAVTATGQDVRVGFANAQAGHTAGAGGFAGFYKPGGATTWTLQVGSPSLGASAPIAAAFGPTNMIYQKLRVECDGPANETRAYVNGVRVAAVSAVPTSIAMYLMAGAYNSSTGTAGGNFAVRCGQFTAHWSK